MRKVPDGVAVILVDHGSRLAEANRMLFDVVALYRQVTGVAIAEAAHMELAEPSIAQAFARCVAQGAREIVIQPYFLSPGRHSTRDIPRMAGEAAAGFPDVRYRVAEPLGLDARMGDIIQRRVLESLGLEGE
jgi:sirohydrochlorin ferrochelatase